MPIKITQEEFIERATKKHNGFYDYSKSVYTGFNKKIVIICPKHGEFKQRTSNHLIGQECRKCGIGDTKNFIDKAIKKHNGYYDYSKSIYISSHKKLIIICPKHGEFKQEANSHLHRHGCPKCSGNAKTTQEEFIEQAGRKHNRFYDYSKSIYTGTTNKLIIICPIHGEFEQIAHSHLGGRGCDKCGGSYTTTQKEFIEGATKKHNGFYDYSKVIYENAKKMVIIICPKHGEFDQNAGNHLLGRGCNKCFGNISKKETAWLDSLNIPAENKQKKIRINDKYFLTDAADIINKIVWEFYGDFWHGNPIIYNPSRINKVRKLSFGELYSITMEREKILKDNGYKVISIWESDFKKQLKKQLNTI